MKVPNLSNLEVGFTILHAPDPGEILRATPLIRSLKKQVEKSWVSCLVPAHLSFLLEDNPHIDQLISYHTKPKEALGQLRELMPDYLIDLVGGWKTRSFKNRLRVMDFTVKRKSPVPFDQQLFQLVHLFDANDDGKGIDKGFEPFDREKLPENFKDGYLAICLDNSGFPSEPITTRMVDLINMSGSYVCLTGSAELRPVSDEIGQQVGCHVFSTCGDFSQKEMMAMMHEAYGIVSFDPQWVKVAEAWGKRNTSLLLTKNDVDALDVGSLSATIQSWKV